MTNLKIIYGANFSGKTKLLSEMYTDPEMKDFKKKSIFLPVQRININFKHSTTYPELDNIDDYLLERRNLYKQGRLIEFLSNVLDVQNAKIENYLKEIFDIELIKNPNEYSDGIRSVMVILLELELISKFDCSEISVLIDEVDGFLYPYQQSIILQKIVDLYPQYKYYVTSHSGIVTLNLSSKPDEIMLKDNVLYPIQREATTNIAYVYNEIFELEPRNKKFIDLTDVLSKIVYDKSYIVTFKSRDEVEKLKNDLIYQMKQLQMDYPQDYKEIEYLYDIAVRLIDDYSI